MVLSCYKKKHINIVKFIPSSKEFMQISIDDNFLRAENQNIKLKVHA